MNTLVCLPVGGNAHIDSLSAVGAVRRRLLDLGLTPGTMAKCLYAAPSGNPKAYLIRGAVIALRNDDARLVRLAN